MSWLDQEKKAIEQAKQNNVKFVRFEENTVLSMEIDFSKPFEEIIDKLQKPKARIPIKLDGETTFKSWDLSKLNPVYQQLIELGATGQTKFKVIRTGQGKTDTRYSLVK